MEILLFLLSCFPIPVNIVLTAAVSWFQFPSSFSFPSISCEVYFNSYLHQSGLILWQSENQLPVLPHTLSQALSLSKHLFSHISLSDMNTLAIQLPKLQSPSSKLLNSNSITFFLLFFLFLQGILKRLFISGNCFLWLLIFEVILVSLICLPTPG